MKIFFLRLFLLGSMLLSEHALLAQRDMKAFEHGAIALDVGTTGIGLSVAVPLHSSVAVRAGVGALPFSFRYTYNNFDPAPEQFSSTDVLLHAKINMLNGLLLFDYFPSRNSSFFLTAGIYAGQNRMIQISGQSTEPIQIGDLIVTPDEVGRGMDENPRGKTLCGYRIRPDAARIPFRLQIRTGSSVHRHTDHTEQQAFIAGRSR